MEGYTHSAYPWLCFPVKWKICTRHKAPQQRLGVHGNGQLEPFSDMLYCKEQENLRTGTATVKAADVLVVSGSKVARSDV